MSENQSRRKSVMSRSIKLGHCVCNPKQPCPCETFKQYNICQCAGERLPVKKGGIELTKYVKKAGCASKISQADLKRILTSLPVHDNPNVLLGSAAGDDAGVYKINENLCLVQTVDVFSPCVDEPYIFGQIAAANSLSDIYAMGAKPLTALSVIGFPSDDLDGKIMEEILRGGIDKMTEAGCAIIGGHSINDSEIKCGYAVTGIIEKDKFLKRDNARQGDVLILTKPIGTGIVSFASQIGRISSLEMSAVSSSMTELNKDAAELLLKYNPNACTDVTGFGLMGHLTEMIKGSGVSAVIDVSALPVFEAAAECLKNRIYSGAVEGNQEYSLAWLRIMDDLPFNDEVLSILFDPQTSGGLLISMNYDDAVKYLQEMQEMGHSSAAIIGKICQRENGDIEGKIYVKNIELKNLIKSEKGNTFMEEKKADEPAPCCAEFAGNILRENPKNNENQTAASVEPPEYKKLYMSFMKEVSKEGYIDLKSKKLMAIALSIAQHCKPCLKIHIKSAREMGISQNEIEEAAYLAIQFAGAPAMMFYNEVLKEIGE